MSKRGNREGSIYRRQDGRWVASVTTRGGGHAGRRKYLYGRTRDEVAKKLTDALKSVKDSLPLPSEQTTVASFARVWLDGLRFSRRPRTVESYEGILRNHVLPALGAIRLNRLQPVHIEALHSALEAKGLSAASIRNFHARINTMLAKAVRLGLVARNVATLVELPRIEKRQLPIVSPREIARFLLNARHERLEALFVLAVTTGARQGELLGLTWDKVDVEMGEIRITHAMQRLDGRSSLVEPKTPGSRRTVALTRMAVEALRRQRLRQSEEALGLGRAWDNTLNLVFTSQVGSPLEKTNVIRRQFKPLLVKTGLPTKLRFHDLRHIAATLALSQGTPVHVVSEMLGHSDAATTLRIYAHVIPGAQRQAADAMEAVLAV